MLKRICDLAISLFILLLILLPLLLTAVLIKLTSTGPILFMQDRLGLNGKVFKLYKFRTMIVANRDFSVQVTDSSNDVTAVGKVIRRFKIDELPQLLNVLKGDMSLVGPRPCLPSLVNDFNDDGKIRLKVRPGLTGLAQVNGNIHLSWQERWAFDRKYVEDQSLTLDIKILFKTVLIVLFGEAWGKKG